MTTTEPKDKLAGDPLSVVDDIKELPSLLAVGRAERTAPITTTEEQLAAALARAEKAEAAWNGLMATRAADKERMRNVGITFEAVREAMRGYENEELTFGRLVELLRVAADELILPARTTITKQAERIRVALDRLRAAHADAQQMHVSGDFGPALGDHCVDLAHICALLSTKDTGEGGA